jgi:hypothetical protein
VLGAGRGQGTQLLRLVRASDTPMRTILGEAPGALDTLADNESRWARVLAGAQRRRARDAPGLAGDWPAARAALRQPDRGAASVKARGQS